MGAAKCLSKSTQKKLLKTFEKLSRCWQFYRPRL